MTVCYFMHLHITYSLVVVVVTLIDWDTGCAIFLGYFYGWKINFWVYFIACNKFLGQVLALNKFLSQIVMKH